MENQKQELIDLYTSKCVFASSLYYHFQYIVEWAGDEYGKSCQQGNRVLLKVKENKKINVALDEIITVRSLGERVICTINMLNDFMIFVY